MSDGGTSVVVAGMIAGVPGQGGAAWAVLQYVLGLRRLGHDVYLLEPVDDIRPATQRYFDEVVRAFGLEGRAALVSPERRVSAGIPYGRVVKTMARAEVLLNIAGMLTSEELLGPVRRRVYLDLDPAFTQAWHADGLDMRFAHHDAFATVGLALGRPDCPVSTCDRHWIPTLPPVVLDLWPYAAQAPSRPWTTVANWRSYGSITTGGVHLGQKAHSFRPLIGLPRALASPPQVALAIHPDESGDLSALHEHQWDLIDPVAVAGTPQRYQEFVASSRGELGVAKSGYVASRCGWFSDRSACYLACGRPVVAQDTGFADHLPVGEGLLSFEDVDGAREAIAAVEGDYGRHRRAARALAQDVLDSDRVLSRLLSAVATPGPIGAVAAR